jgi:aldehyde:ferredoxin oxidoreductase
VLTLRQAFNAREGIRPDQINLPKRIAQETLPIKGAPPKIDFQALKEGYFAAMGWDIKTGMPYRETLEDLGLSDLVLAEI